jgi:hypothetical protein
MLSKLVLAVVTGVLVTLVCVFVGGILTAATGISWVVSTGQFLQGYGALLGLLTALWYFFTNGSWTFPRA